MSSGCNALVVPFQQLLEGPIEVLLCERVNDLRHGLFSRGYSNCCRSCSFEAEILKIGQSSHKMYSNNIVNFQESKTILKCQYKKKSGNLLKAPRICRYKVSKVGDPPVEGDPKAPFSIATTPRCRGGRYSFPGWLYFTLDPHLYNAEC